MGSRVMSEQVGSGQASFVIESGANAGLQVSIGAVLDGGRPAFLIGSDPRSHLQLSAVDALPAHAILLRRAGGHFLQPRFPHCVVLVNGRRINRPTCLLPGDVVQIGAATLRFDQQEGEAAEPDVRPPLANPKPAAAAAPAQPVQPVEPRVPQPTPALSPVERAASAVHEPVIYRPATQVEGGVNLAATLLGVISVLAIIGVVAYGLISGGGVQTSEAANFAYNDGNVTLLMFEASWCTFCKQQQPIVSALADEYRGDVYVEYVDIDNPRNRGLVNRFAARSVPLLVVMNDRGEVVATFRGLTPARSLRPALERALSQSTGTAVTSR